MVAKRKDDLEEHSQPQSSSSLGTASALARAGREAFPFPFPPAPLLQGGPHLLQEPVPGREAFPFPFPPAPLLQGGSHLLQEQEVSSTARRRAPWGGFARDLASTAPSVAR